MIHSYWITIDGRWTCCRLPRSLCPSLTEGGRREGSTTKPILSLPLAKGLDGEEQPLVGDSAVSFLRMGTNPPRGRAGHGARPALPLPAPDARGRRGGQPGPPARPPPGLPRDGSGSRQRVSRGLPGAAPPPPSPRAGCFLLPDRSAAAGGAQGRRGRAGGRNRAGRRAGREPLCGGAEAAAGPLCAAGTATPVGPPTREAFWAGGAGRERRRRRAPRAAR